MSRTMAGLHTALALALLSGCPSPDQTDLPVAPGRGLLAGPGISAVRTLAQNWTDEEAMEFYTFPQGSKLAPYQVFLHLEMATSRAPFRGEENIRTLGYLPLAVSRQYNPEGLPMGFVQDGDHVGLTCAACHTSQINYQGTAFLIDGGPTIGDAATLLSDLVGALRAARADTDGKLQRLARATGLGVELLTPQLDSVIERLAGYTTRNLPADGQPAFGPGRIDAFGAILNEVAVRFAGVPDNETRSDAPVSYPFLWDTPQHDFVQWPGTTPNSKSDAMKLLVGTKHYGALGRNIGEVLGVFGDVNTEDPRGLLGVYRSSVNKATLIQLEEFVTTLWSPQWPEREFGPIDTAQRTLGEQVYRDAGCSSCHQSIQRDSPTRTVKAIMVDVQTDPTMIRNAVERVSRTGRFRGRLYLAGRGAKVIGAQEPTMNLLSHVGQRVILSRDNRSLIQGDTVGLFASDSSDLAVLASLDAEYSPFRITMGLPTIEGGLSRSFSEFHYRNGSVVAVGNDTVFRRIGDDVGAPVTRQGLTGIQVQPGIGRSITVNQFAQLSELSLTGPAAASAGGARYAYKARPLNGIWATAPYLHNGSIPSLYELLLPPARRSRTFYAGSREYDPVRVGYVSTSGPFLFSTASVPMGSSVYTGNSNAGHDYSGINGIPFTEQQIAALIAYLKSQ